MHILSHMHIINWCYISIAVVSAIVFILFPVSILSIMLSNLCGIDEKFLMGLVRMFLQIDVLGDE